MPWQTGEACSERLADHDPAVNAFNWQWVAGSGADAAPFPRLQPVTAGVDLRPRGDYSRRWIPSSGRLDARWTHSTVGHAPTELGHAAVPIGRHYTCADCRSPGGPGASVRGFARCARSTPIHM